MKHDFLIGTAITAILFTSTAHAYLDPGTGSYVLQLLIGGIAAGLVGIKIFSSNLRLFFGRFLKQRKSVEPISDEASRQNEGDQ